MPTSTPRRYVRKQVSVTPEQDRALKRRSQELGVSEAEVVRRLLDAALAGAPSDDTPLDALLANTERLAEGRRLDAPVERDVLHDRGRRP